MAKYGLIQSNQHSLVITGNFCTGKDRVKQVAGAAMGIELNHTTHTAKGISQL
jgi:hypothetical protein